VRSSKTAMSVNVPPISAARRRFEPLARDGLRGFILSFVIGKGIAVAVRRAQPLRRSPAGVRFGGDRCGGVSVRWVTELAGSLEATPAARGQAGPPTIGRRRALFS